MKMAKDDSKAHYKCGASAFKQGKSIKDNPYNYLNQKGHDWHDGFKDAEKVAKK